MKKIFLNIMIPVIFIVSIFTVVSYTNPVHAGLKSWCDIIGGNCDNSVGGPETEIKTRDDLSSRIRMWIVLVFGFLAVVFIGLTLYGAFLLVTSGDNQDRNQSGRKILKNGVIGFVGTFALFLIIGYLIGVLGLGNVFTLPEEILS